MVEVWRGAFVESQHRGHAAIVEADGTLRASWGSPDAVIYPRSSAKMLQALPLVESGAAAALGLRENHLALACASHQGSPLHTDLVSDWLTNIGRDAGDLRCGPQPPRLSGDRQALRDAGQSLSRVHNTCSGKHTGFLTVAGHIGGGLDYVDVDHPVQKSVKAAFEEMTDVASAGWAPDGCSAPNFTTTVRGLANAMAKMAAPGSGVRGDAARSLVQAMIARPDLVAGEQRACTDLMEAMDGVAVKTGAEGVFVAILPAAGLGVALKIEDGATRAAEAAIAGMLCSLGALSPDHPVAKRLMAGAIRNWDGIETGRIGLAERFLA